MFESTITTPLHEQRPASTATGYRECGRSTVTPAAPWQVGVEELTDAERARVLPAVRRLRWTERVPLLYPLAVRYHRGVKRLEWMCTSNEFAQDKQYGDLPVRVKRHKSLLLRQLGETEMWMQHNKVTNLKLACAQVDGVIIRPGQTFSFNKLVGNATRRKGYTKGMRLSNGQAKPGIGGGICQLANLLHWMVLHSPMTVTQRSTHSFDPFPDNGRVLPWGVGCSIVYNYVDLQFRNDTEQTFQLRLSVGDRYLEGEILADVPAESSYRVFAKGERFLRVGADYFRRNEIWRTVIDRRRGTPVRDELIRENVALVKYVPNDVPVVDVVLPEQYPPRH
jgi:vancomycin resistance protein VanW